MPTTNQAAHTHSKSSAAEPVTNLRRMVDTTPTSLWNDSIVQTELEYALANGAEGATCNPVIVLSALRSEAAIWAEPIRQLVQQRPSDGEDELAWEFVARLSALRAKLLLPAFERTGGRRGRLSVQTDPRFYRNAAAIVEQAVHFDALAPNIIVKVPATRAGIAAMEECTYRGISINATVCFTTPQCLAVAEAVERGLRRREKEGLPVAGMGPVCTIMVGRLDDWLKIAVARAGTMIDPGFLEWAGVAVFKHTYRIFQERRYRLRLLSAAFRNHLHWSELIGGDVVISPPHKWQVWFNASDIEVIPRMDHPVDPRISRTLLDKVPDFRRAFEADGLGLDEFDTFAPTVRTLCQFAEACQQLAGEMRAALLPDPGKR